MIFKRTIISKKVVEELADKFEQKRIQKEKEGRKISSYGFIWEKSDIDFIISNLLDVAVEFFHESGRNLKDPRVQELRDQVKTLKALKWLDPQTVEVLDSYVNSPYFYNA